MRARQRWSTDVRNPYFEAYSDTSLQARVLTLEDYFVEVNTRLGEGRNPEGWLDEVRVYYNYDDSESWSVVADIEAELKARAEETE